MLEKGTAIMSLDDFMQAYSKEAPFEIIDGERIPMTPQILNSAMIAGELYFQLRLFLQKNDLGQVFMEAPFVLTLEANWVKGARVPDVMFVSAEKLSKRQAEDPDFDKKPFVGIPDLVVEVISPTDSYSDVDKKSPAILE